MAHRKQQINKILHFKTTSTTTISTAALHFKGGTCIKKGKKKKNGCRFSIFSKSPNIIDLGSQVWEPRIKIVWQLLFFLLQIFTDIQEEFKNESVILVLEHWVDTLIYFWMHGNSQLLNFSSWAIKAKVSLYVMWSQVWEIIHANKMSELILGNIGTLSSNYSSKFAKHFGMEFYVSFLKIRFQPLKLVLK